MAIPRSQLDTWANQGALTTSAAAYASIDRALRAANASSQVRGSDIFLQGSYANATNIYGESDVDVVVLYGDSWHRDLSALTPEEQRLYHQTYDTATYVWDDLRNDVLAALRAHFGYAAVVPGTKAMKVTTGHGRMTADVVPALGFRKYATFLGDANATAHCGIQFFDSAGNAIVNYPKYHRVRGEAKNDISRTRGQYKETVRIFKNFRTYLYDNGLLADGSAPSYFVECTLHNVPDNLFVGDLDETVPDILNYLANTSPLGFLCQNGVVPLIGSGNTQWSAPSLNAFIVAAISAWNNW